MGFAVQIVAMFLRVVNWAFFTVFRGFMFYIDVVDAFLTTGLFWLVLHKGYGWNGWWAVALGLVVSLILYIILMHRIGFWFVAPIFAAIWASLFGVILDGFFPTMPEILFWVICIAIFAWNVKLHDHTRYRREAMEMIEAEKAEDKRQAQLDD